MFDSLPDCEVVFHEEKALATAFPVRDRLFQYLCVFGILLYDDAVGFEVGDDDRFEICVFEALTDGVEVICRDFEAVFVVVIVLAQLLEDVFLLEVVPLWTFARERTVNA